MKRVLCILQEAGVLAGERITAHFSTAGELPGITGGRVEFAARMIFPAGEPRGRVCSPFHFSRLKLASAPKLVLPFRT